MAEFEWLDCADLVSAPTGRVSDCCCTQRSAMYGDRSSSHRGGLGGAMLFYFVVGGVSSG